MEYATGDMAKTGTALLLIELSEEPSGDGEASPEAAEPEAAAPTAAAAAAPSSAPMTAVSQGKVRSTPATRALAKQHSIDLSTVTATGVLPLVAYGSE